MNKSTFLTIIFSLLFIFEMEGQVMFQKTYGGMDDDGGYSVQQTSDGGYVVAGGTLSFGAGSADVYLIKTDANGDTIWTRTFGGTDGEAGYSVEQTSDGGYIIAGEIGFTLGHSDVYLIKTDSNGNLLWTKIFGGNFTNYGSSVKQTSDGGYIIAGYTEYLGTGGDIYLIKTDSNGNSVWTKTFGGTGNEHGNSVQQTSDGGYIIAGKTYNSFNPGYSDVYLIKTDSNGNSVWSKTFGGPITDEGYSVEQTTDGGYIIAGSTNSFGAGSGNVYLIKTDSNGDSLWTKIFDAINIYFGYSVQQTADGGFIISGYSLDINIGFNIYLIKTDSNGNSLWTKTYGGYNNNFFNSVMQTTDGGYIITGTTNSSGAGNNDVYLIKTDSLGNSGCIDSNKIITSISPATQVTSPPTIVTSQPEIVTSLATLVGSGATVTTLCSSVGINEIKNEDEIILYPNPFDEQIFISEKGNGPVEITLCDFTGRKIFTQSFKNSITINTGQLAKGIYLYEVRNKKGVIKKGKVVKE